MKSESSTYREDFPHYSGHIPYKKNEVIGMTVGATNEYIQQILTKEPVKEAYLVPLVSNDYSYYNKDYFNSTFSREYKLEEENVFSNKSKDAETWISSSKYKIYPQHIPGYKAHVPGVYSGNIVGLSYSKSTAIAIKGDYDKGFDSNKTDRYKTCNMKDFVRPKMRSDGKKIIYLLNNNTLLYRRNQTFRPRKKTKNPRNKKRNISQTRSEKGLQI